MPDDPWWSVRFLTKTGWIDKTCFYNLRRKWNFILILHPKNDNSWWIFEPKIFGQLKKFFMRNLASTVNPRHKLSNMRDLYWEWSSSSKASINKLYLMAQWTPKRPWKIYLGIMVLVKTQFIAGFQPTMTKQHRNVISSMNFHSIM